MNTGFLGPAVATVLTACGIETQILAFLLCIRRQLSLQQYLPLAVLKLHPYNRLHRCTLQQYLPLAVLKLLARSSVLRNTNVATVLTACGIETRLINPTPSY